MQETDHTGKRRVIRPLLRNGIAVVAVALVGVGFTTPAHAEDPSTPTPLMLGESAVIPPEETQATPADVTPPVEPSAEVLPPEVQEIPAKSTRAERPDVSRRVISAMPRARFNTARAVHPRAVAEWYQVSERQYRPVGHGTRPPRVTNHAQNAPSPVDAAPKRKVGVPQTPRVRRDSASHTCVELCAADRRYNVGWNAPDISTCILDRGPLCELLLERARALMSPALSRGTGQYQRAGAQYQSTDFDGAARRAVKANTAGWQLVGGNTSEIAAESVRRTVPAKPTMAPQVHATLASKSPPAATVHRIRTPNSVRMSAGSAETPRRGAGSEPAMVARARTASASSDWFIRTLLLLGMAAIALLLLAAAKVGGLDRGVTELGYRVGSRGLTPNRIVLRNAAGQPRKPRGSGIRYRE